MPNFYDKFVNC